MKKVCDTVKNWGHHRREDVRVFLNYYEFFMILVLLISTAREVALTFESVVVTAEYYLEELEMVLLGLFACECVLKMFADGCDYFKSLWNLLDLSIVLICELELTREGIEDRTESDGSQALSFTSILRLVIGLKGVKMFRIFRIFRYFQHVRATWSRFHVALGSVVGLLVVTICKSLMFSVLLRVFFSQSDPERFGSLLNTTATVFQLLTLDNWMNIYYTSRDNGAPYIGIIIVLFIIFESLIFFNLTFTVFVETFMHTGEKKTTLKTQEEDKCELKSETEQRTDQTSSGDNEDNGENVEDDKDVGERKEALTVRYLQLLKKIDEKHNQLNEMAKIQHRFTEFMYNEPV
ncbi:cation channel sperm-associated protein 1-like [Triplophysa dalaica]|uniref:cation channel sperm-associated protein 1-like n=1 Tax=Triplophysa dalaica TaxID=1582913 RepID=UPI0024DF6A08|nr:cation channel sperm-associated protein 1-like [Triplophysa dalaica]